MSKDAFFFKRNHFLTVIPWKLSMWFVQVENELATMITHYEDD